MVSVDQTASTQIDLLPGNKGVFCHGRLLVYAGSPNTDPYDCTSLPAEPSSHPDFNCCNIQSDVGKCSSF